LLEAHDIEVVAALGDTAELLAVLER